MPSFPSYYLSDLERKRERSRKLREGLQSGMAGAFEGVDRLAQLQMALQGKAAAGEEKKAKAATEAERWKAEQGTEADRWKAEHELSLRREDRLDRDRVGAATPETEAPAETTSDILTRMQGVLGGQESGEIVPEDVEGQTTSPEASGILEKLRASMEPGAAPMEPAPPSVADKQEAARLRKMEADAAIAERKAKGGRGVIDPSSKKEIDRQLAALRLKAAEAKAAGGGTVDTKDVDKLRNEFNSLPVVKQYRDVEISVNKMKKAATNPTAAGDLSLIFAFMKTLDPTSTVREGEFANAQNATGVPERVMNEYNRVMSGERLNEQQRADFLGQAEHFLAAHKTAYDEAAASYGGLAGRRGMSAGDVVMGVPSAGPLGNAPPRDPSETRRAYYERLRAGGMDHQAALAAARGGQ
jgi:hypothetical protein